MISVSQFKNIVALVLMVFSHQAFAVIVDVQPKRIIFERARTSAQVTLLNESDKPVTYEISLINMDVDEKGNLREVTAASSKETSMYAIDVPGLLSVYPNRPLTLQPKESRVLKLWVRRPVDLKPGEYRSHLKIQESAKQPVASQPTENLSVAVRILTGVTIPVMVRHEVDAGQAELSDLALVKGKNNRYHANFNVNRRGLASLVGDYQVSFTPVGGAPIEAGRLVGSVFASQAARQLDFDMPDEVQKLLAIGTKGTLTARVYGVANKEETSRRKPALLAELMLDVK